MRFTTLVLGMLFIFGLLLTSGISYGYERAIEAEMADAIEAPMIIDDGPVYMDGRTSIGWWRW